ncbi:hypothetical protein EA462_03745 [Natrarchaeobius halalkaliphilus]|uniref:Polymer-forming cytoskeletal protein n=1 Tax=Natrarchaeobius halalkaliphilus TaxID=1679091 RepID=A0A3N6P0W7_9EURY|nr:hypothetical protein [Natrarchaeobius halalkaliphilus]RQG91119.1 hypothetical protein EA462_03745 [Natrarchaeobius halalkaliphilus]
MDLTDSDIGGDVTGHYEPVSIEPTAVDGSVRTTDDVQMVDGTVVEGDLETDSGTLSLDDATIVGHAFARTTPTSSVTATRRSTASTVEAIVDFRSICSFYILYGRVKQTRPIALAG